MKGISYTAKRLVWIASLLSAVAVHPSFSWGRGITDSYGSIEGRYQVCTSVVPTSLDFSDVIVGESVTGTLTITNAGTVDLNATSIAISGTDAGLFGVDTTPFTIPPAQSRALEVSFTPTQVGSFEASLDLVCDGVATSLSLRGAGTRLLIVVTPVSTPVAGNSVELTVTLPANYQPDQQEFFFRPTAQTTYQSISLTLTGTSGTVVVPAEAVTPRGIEYYFRFVRGQNVTTVPGNDPENNPIGLRVQVNQLSADVDLRALQYQMVSVPLDLGDAQIAAVLGDDYDAYGPDRWRLFRWDPTLEAYREFPNLIATFTPGTAFWLNTRVGEGFDVEDGQSVNASRPYELVVQPGWNQIGNPFAFPLAWSSVTGSGQVEAPFAYDGTEYQPQQTVLQPWRGYFVFNPGGSSVALSFPPIEATTQAPKRTTRPRSVTEAGYVLQLSASAPAYGLRDTYNYLGFHDQASPGRDHVDFADPPGIGNLLRLSFIENHERLAGSFKPIGGDGQQWELELAVAVEGEILPVRKQVQVTLQEHGARPAGFEIYVLDRDLGRAVPIEEGVFSVEISPSQPVRHLQVIVGTKVYAELESEEIPLEVLADALYQNYPNPFNPQTRIGYQLSERKEVVLAVYDVLGRRVRALIRGEQGAGRYEVVWDGRDGSGRSVAAGVYVVRMEASGFTAIRKMLLLR